MKSKTIFQTLWILAGTSLVIAAGILAIAQSYKAAISCAGIGCLYFWMALKKENTMSDDKQDTVGNGDPKYYESKCSKCGKPLDDLEVDLCWECREVRDSKDLDLTINVGPIPHATFITKNDCTPHAMEFFDGEKLILALSWENGKMTAEYDDANLDKAAKTFVDALLPHMTDVMNQIIAQAREEK